MAIGLSLTTQGLKPLVNKLIAHSNKIKNKRAQLFARLSVLGFKDVQDHFKKETGPKGSWKRLSPVTLALRKKGGKGAKKLQDKGNLRNSLTPNIGLKMIRANSTILSIGGSQKGLVETYAADHNFGLRGQVKREFMWLSKDVKGKIKKQVIKFISWT